MRPTILSVVARLGCALDQFDKSSRCVMGRHQAQFFAVPAIDISRRGVADAHGICQHRLKNRFEISWRTADDAQHIRSRRLLLQRLAQFAEQPGVLDGDHRLGGEVRQQLYVLVGERPNFLPIDGHHTDRLIFLQQRHHDEGARLRRGCEGPAQRVILINPPGEIGDLDRPLAGDRLLAHATHKAGRFPSWLTLPQFGISGRCIVHRDDTIGIALAQRQ